jgi:hypothetical protein
VRDLEVFIELDGVREHQSGHPLKLLGCQILLELLQVALEGLLVYQRELAENRCARVVMVVAEHGGVGGGRGRQLRLDKGDMWWLSF